MVSGEDISVKVSIDSIYASINHTVSISRWYLPGMTLECMGKRHTQRMWSHPKLQQWRILSAIMKTADIISWLRLIITQMMLLGQLYGLLNGSGHQCHSAQLLCQQDTKRHPNQLVLGIKHNMNYESKSTKSTMTLDSNIDTSLACLFAQVTKASSSTNICQRGVKKLQKLPKSPNYANRLHYLTMNVWAPLCCCPCLIYDPHMQIKRLKSWF